MHVESLFVGVIIALVIISIHMFAMKESIHGYKGQGNPNVDSVISHTAAGANVKQIVGSLNKKSPIFF